MGKLGKSVLHLALKACSHGAAAAAFFFASTIGLHCNKWSHSHCVVAAAAAAMVPQGATSEWVPTPFCAAAAAAKHFSPIAAPLPQPLPHRVNEP